MTLTALHRSSYVFWLEPFVGVLPSLSDMAQYTISIEVLDRKVGNWCAMY